MRSRKLVIGFGLLLAASTTVPALAQSGSGGPSYPPSCAASSVPQVESDKAHAIYQAGKVQYDDANYDAAIVQFRDAYKRDCAKHDLLIIISRAYELKGDKAEAIKALEMYLERVKDSPDASTHRNRIDNLKRQLAAQPVAPAAPPPSSTTPISTTPPPAGEVREHTVAPWILVGIGGAAVITGAVLLIAGPKVPANCDESTAKCEFGNPPMSQASFDASAEEAGRAVGMRTGGVVTLIAGAGVMGGGLLWHFLEPTGPAPTVGAARPRVSPVVGPGYAGMALGGRF